MKGVPKCRNKICPRLGIRAPPLVRGYSRDLLPESSSLCKRSAHSTYVFARARSCLRITDDCARGFKRTGSVGLGGSALGKELVAGLVGGGGEAAGGASDGDGGAGGAEHCWGVGWESGDVKDVDCDDVDRDDGERASCQRPARERVRPARARESLPANHRTDGGNRSVLPASASASARLPPLS